MTPLVDIKPGQWVLAFNEPFGPYDCTLAEHLEKFASQGGGWDHVSCDELFHLYRVSWVMPKTYNADEMVTHWRAYLKKRLCRSLVIAAGDRREMIDLRDRFYEIGVDTTRRINTEMHRVVAKFAQREEAKALQRIHSILPHVFEPAEGNSP
ncbi:hypothetical protein DEM27_15475 [Metarhizobium album]|uniref:Uncharacterized protein n=1 Tax=Metarhizobium album TaxID=2182425 RepID=A0A2U2DQ72_9HYPH|nr:hypothetical protein [Rhizobium album]PWE55453.1 hypothetical protein DEM27_15475 [Rhizobium album]